MGIRFLTKYFDLDKSFVFQKKSFFEIFIFFFGKNRDLRKKCHFLYIFNLPFIFEFLCQAHVNTLLL